MFPPLQAIAHYEQAADYYKGEESNRLVMQECMQNCILTKKQFKSFCLTFLLLYFHSVALQTSVFSRSLHIVLSWNSIRRLLRSMNRQQAYYLTIFRIFVECLPTLRICLIIIIVQMLLGWNEYHGQPFAEIQCQRILLQSLFMSLHCG